MLITSFISNSSRVAPQVSWFKTTLIHFKLGLGAATLVSSSSLFNTFLPLRKLSNA